MSTDIATLHWTENGQARQALWQADNGARLPTRVQVYTDGDPAQAHRLASAGTGLLWRGTYPQARQLLQGMSARLDAATERQRSRSPQIPVEAGAAFGMEFQAGVASRFGVRRADIASPQSSARIRLPISAMRRGARRSASGISRSAPSIAVSARSPTSAAPRSSRTVTRC